MQKRKKYKRIVKVLMIQTLMLFLLSTNVFANSVQNTSSIETEAYNNAVAEGGDTGKSGDEVFDSGILFAIKWLNKVGLVVALIGLIQFAIAIKSQNPESKTSGIQFFVVGCMIASIATETFAKSLGLL